MEDMQRLVEERSMNHKMTSTIKESRSGLDRIEVPMYTWFYLARSKEIYRYNQGVFKAHTTHTPQPGLIPTASKSFYTHHHLKVPTEDTVRAEVSVGKELIILDKVYPPCKIWREVTDTEESETIILQQNKRHLQQAPIEDGQVHNPMIQKMVENYGCNNLIDELSGMEE